MNNKCCNEDSILHKRDAYDFDEKMEIGYCPECKTEYERYFRWNNEERVKDQGYEPLKWKRRDDKNV